LGREGGRDVILITLDTVRADHLGCYGDPAARTPLLDRWARRGVLIRDCIADVPLTLPSHATLFTGRTALSHGVRDNGAARLGEGAVTLAETLVSRGFLTGAVISSPVVHSRFGLVQGFVFYEDSLTSPYVPQDESRLPAQRHWLPKQDRRAPEAISKSLEWLEQAAAHARRSPFFHWLHLYDAHFPYDPSPPWQRIAPDLYDAEIASMDRALVRLERWLHESERVGEFVLAVVADHGEGLAAHLEDEHGIFVYDEVARVPCILSAPGMPAGLVWNAQARTIDLAATIAELAGGRSSGDATRFGDGGSLVAAFSGRGAAPDSVAYSESIHSRRAYSASGVKSVRTASWKMIACVRPELYDLARDPGERINLWPTVSEEKREEMRAVLRDEIARALRESGGPDAEPMESDAETTEALRALGYAASPKRIELPGSVEDEMVFDGFDPKDMVDVVLAGRNLENGFLKEAERKLSRFSRSPQARIPALRSLAHQNSAKAAIMRRQFARAAGEYEKALRAEPSNPDAAWGVVYAWNLGGRPEAGERRGRELLHARPMDERLRLHHALSLALLGQHSTAIEILDRLAKDATDPETAGVAALYAEKIGSAEEQRYLDAYLGSEATIP
jgi:arylsulfatase A-like enzyme